MNYSGSIRLKGIGYPEAKNQKKLTTKNTKTKTYNLIFELLSELRALRGDPCPASWAKRLY